MRSDERAASASATSSRPLGDLVSRLAAEGRLRGTRLDGRAVGSAALSDIAVTGVTNDSRSAAAASLFVAIAAEHAALLGGELRRVDRDREVARGLAGVLAGLVASARGERHREQRGGR